jgi:response regulator of citrate/malate metabolism
MINVVIIEDDPMVSMITEKIISSNKKFNVVEKFANGKGVIDYLLKNKVDLIILDMYLPDTEGLDILEELRKEEERYDKYINAIFVTASNDRKHIERAFLLGIVDYLIKPFEFERLEEALDRYFSKNSNLSISNILTQKELDNLYHKDTLSKVEKVLPKGISEKTLDKIMSTILSNPNKEWSSKDVADSIESSTVTVKKYLDYLAEIGEIKSNIYYGSVGRPEVKYKVII